MRAMAARRHAASAFGLRRLMLGLMLGPMLGPMLGW
jgi:hypothetical protein